MKNDHAFEALLHEALGRRGAPPPFSIDVHDRVMARVAAMGVPPRTELGLRQFTRWAVAASLVGLVLLAAALWRGPSYSEVASSLAHVVAGGTDAALKLKDPAGSLAATLGRVGFALVASAQTLVRPLAPFQPFAHALLAALAAAMLGITTFVVGRDVVRSATEKEHA
jgi:hypothetical protein